MKTNPICRVCKVTLDSENWYPTYQTQNNHLCKTCAGNYFKQWKKEHPGRAEALRSKWRKEHPEKSRAQNAKWRKANPDKMRAMDTRARRKKGVRPFNENKACAMYLGCHIAERVLSHVFKDVIVMPYGNPGYDFICNKGKWIDVKSACQRKDGRWHFHIRHNTMADYFLCLAFDNREDLNPLHAWLLPGDKFSHLGDTSIFPSTIDKWNAYRLDLTKIASCCDAIR